MGLQRSYKLGMETEMNFIIRDLRNLVGDIQRDLDSIKEYLGKLEDLIQPENRPKGGEMVLVEDVFVPYPQPWCKHGLLRDCGECPKKP